MLGWQSHCSPWPRGWHTCRTGSRSLPSDPRGSGGSPRKQMLTYFRGQKGHNLHSEWIFWADSVEFSTPAWGTPRCPQSPRVWVRDNGSWRPWGASPGSSGRSGASRGQQTGRQPRDHWGQSWRPGYGPASERRHYCHQNHDWLFADQDAVLDGPGRDPMEHACAVILHLRLDEVKVPGLIIIINNR